MNIAQIMLMLKRPGNLLVETFCRKPTVLKRSIFAEISREAQKRTLTTNKRLLLASKRPLISEQECQEFQDNGVVCLRGAFDEHWLKICERGTSCNIHSSWYGVPYLEADR